MSDQAQGLRQLLQARLEPIPAEALPRSEPGRVILFTSGKGGVGTSNLALNTAIALGQAGSRVRLIDADFGLANLDVLCGLTPPLDLGSALTAKRPLAEALVDGPAGIELLAGAHGLRTPLPALAAAPDRLAAELPALRRHVDFVLLDAGSGLEPPEPLITAADEVVIVTTTEPTALADTQALLARLKGVSDACDAPPPTLRVLVNQARNRFEATACLEGIRSQAREFLGAVVLPLGWIRTDPRLRRAVGLRRPLAVAFPHAPATRGTRRLAATLRAERASAPPAAPRARLRTVLAGRWQQHQPRAPASVA